MTRGKGENGIIPSSGNVFADLGVSDAGEKQTKVRLAVAINHILEKAHVLVDPGAGRLDKLAGLFRRLISTDCCVGRANPGLY